MGIHNAGLRATSRYSESTRPDYRLFGNLVDLVAWDEWHQWRLRVGAASWLGTIEPQYCEPAPVRVWRSPLNWFRAGCAGLVILTQEHAEVHRLLAGCFGGIIAQDWNHAAELQKALDRPWPVPRVHVASSVAAEVRRAA